MMRYWPILLGLAASLLLTTRAPAQVGSPIPPGIRAADKAQEKSDRGIEPPAGPVQPKLSSAEVLQQADELLALAQQVHSDTAQATQGLLAKDLKDKLKRLEKLSKRLREELVP